MALGEGKPSLLLEFITSWKPGQGGVSPATVREIRLCWEMVVVAGDRDRDRDREAGSGSLLGCRGQWRCCLPGSR